MLKIIARTSMLLFLLAVPFLFYGFGRETLDVCRKISLSDRRCLWFSGGALAFVPCMFVGKRVLPGAWAYLETLEHELTHLLIGLIFLKIPVGFRVSAHAGGEVRQIGFGSTGETWIALAPYFFPTVSLAVLIVAYFFGVGAFYIFALLGWTSVFHLVSNWGETSFRQPDLRKAGIVKTVLILPVMNLICYGSILAYVAGGRRGFGVFWIQSISSSYALANRLLLGG